MKIPLQAAVAVAVLLAVTMSFGKVTAWHGGGADLGADAFSAPLAPIHLGLSGDGSYISCEIGNFGGPAPIGTIPGGAGWIGHPLEQHWKVLSRGADGPDGTHEIGIRVGAFTVNAAAEAGKVRASATDEDAIVKSIELVHLPSDGATNEGVLTLRVRSNVVYDLLIENIATSPLEVARHYRIGATEPFVEIGFGHPSLEYLEPGRNRWAVNSHGRDYVEVALFVDDETPPVAPGVPPQAKTVDYTMTVGLTGPTLDSAVGEPVGFTMPVSIAGTVPGRPKDATTLVLTVIADGHYQLSKQPGLDHGIYVLDCPKPDGPPPPPSPVGGRMTGGGSVIDDLAGRVTHGFELRCDVADTPNRLEINWGRGETGSRFHLESLDRALCLNSPGFSEGKPVAGFDTYRGRGTGRLNGETGWQIRFGITDRGEPGVHDTFGFAIWAPEDDPDTDAPILDLRPGLPLEKGNHQAHPDS